jgi:hypothetical protein
MTGPEILFLIADGVLLGIPMSLLIAAILSPDARSTGVRDLAGAGVPATRAA